MDVIGNFDLDVAGFEAGYPRSGKGDPAMQAKAVELAEKADIVLLYIGLDEISESEGLDRAHMRLPQSQVDLLEAVAVVNPNVVAVMSAGSAVEMPWLPKCKALIHGYLCGQAGASSVLRAIMGEVNPSGKLAETYPVKYEDVSSAPYFPAKERTAEYRESIFVGYRYFETANVPVLFPFGFGLSYTTFEYSDLTVTDKEASFTLKNTGTMDGAEVAQLYVSKTDGDVFRPAKELKGFQKVFLKAGESRQVTIKLDDEAFRYFNVNTNQFEVEGGEWNILIGASVADIKLSGKVSVQGTGAASPYEKAKFAKYFSGDIKSISDGEFEALLGRPIPDGNWSGTLGMNDAICQLYYAKSWIRGWTLMLLGALAGLLSLLLGWYVNRAGLGNLGLLGCTFSGLLPGLELPVRTSGLDRNEGTVRHRTKGRDCFIQKRSLPLIWRVQFGGINRYPTPRIFSIGLYPSTINFFRRVLIWTFTVSFPPSSKL